ncbi:MAG: hypothetical protein ACR2GX_08055 [Candidatus Dormibacteria bacterium]
MSVIGSTGLEVYKCVMRPHPHNPAVPPVFSNARADYFWVHDLAVLLVVVALVIGTIIVVRILARRPAGTPPPMATTHALYELDMRYARSEIDRDEYLQRWADLLHAAPPSPGTTAPPVTTTEPPAPQPGLAP